MKLGISSLGYIIEYGLSNKYESLTELVYEASEDCLDFAEKNDIKTVELVLEPPEVLHNERQHDFIDLVNSYSLERQVAQVVRESLRLSRLLTTICFGLRSHSLQKNLDHHLSGKPSVVLVPLLID